EKPPGLDEARARLGETVRAIMEDISGPDGFESEEGLSWAFGGFSQGAMLSMDTSLRSELPPPSVLLQFSGSLICSSEWKKHLSRLSGTKVLQTHGTMDPILPFQSARRVEKMLEQAGVDLRFHSFDGPHTIDGEAITLSANALAVLAG
ncbi:MAG: lysophospholipase, partial [Planctomycetota bacterium]